jgi:RHS repeat-associated protein
MLLAGNYISLKTGNLVMRLSALLLILTVLSTPLVAAETLSYDANGNLVEDGQFKYVYNAANRLSEVKTLSGETVARYWYDYSGNRIKKEEGGVVTYYPNDLIETELSGGSRQDTYYYFANGERVAKKNETGTYYYHPDHLGSTSLITDEAANTVERTRYYPFGAVLSGGAEKHGYTDQELDAETGLMYYNARYYSPELRRFVAADPIIQDVYDPQTLNRYAYVRNNPIILVDPSGKSFEDSDLYCQDKYGIPGWAIWDPKWGFCFGDIANKNTKRMND